MRQVACHNDDLKKTNISSILLSSIVYSKFHEFIQRNAEKIGPVVPSSRGYGEVNKIESVNDLYTTQHLAIKYYIRKEMTWRAIPKYCLQKASSML